jgi:putative ABC transport system ATP-binding protein
VSTNEVSDPILVAESVRKIYRSGGEEVVALHGLDLRVDAGEFVAVMGPSGSGKTTLLNCLSGLDEIDSGRVLVEGKSIHELPDAERTRLRASSMGFIFQAFNLIPVFTATENVELPLLLNGVPEREARAQARATLARVGLGHRLERRPPELSGGEQQRVAVARALAGDPKLVWADEPTGNLDSEMAAAVMELLAELHAEGLSIVLVTHDAGVAARADRLLTVRDGRLVGDRALEPRTTAPEPVGTLAGSP